jgi:hypothetical protein
MTASTGPSGFNLTRDIQKPEVRCFAGETPLQHYLQAAAASG